MKGMGNLGDMGGLMKHAQKMQQEVARIQKELQERVVEGTSGGGMVKAMVNGRQDVVAVKIDPEAVEPQDVEMLEDLILAAISAGMKKSRELAEKEMAKATG